MKSSEMGKDIDCLIVGYAGVDRIIKVSEMPEKGKTCKITNKDNHVVSYGGNGSNVAACMANLGCKVTPLMRVGCDWEELGYRKKLLDYGVDISAVTVIPEETTSICHLIECPDGNHLTMTYPGAMNDKYATDNYGDSLFQRARYGVVTVATKNDIKHFIAHAEKNKLPLVFGVRIDLDCFSPETFEYLLSNSEVIFMNESEKEFIESHFNPLQHYLDRGKAKHIIVTLGSQGSMVLLKDGKKVSVPAVPGIEVIDTTGAGDSYIAGYLYGYLRGYDARTCAIYGNTESSFIIRKQGCISEVPTEGELLQKAAVIQNGSNDSE